MSIQLADHVTCCGIKILYSFSRMFPDSTLREFQQLQKQDGWITWRGSRIFNETGTRGKLIEIVLNQTQIEELPRVIEAMIEFGFKPVNRFNNSTGGVCTVFHYVCDAAQRTIPDNDPAWGRPKVVAEPAPEPVPVQPRPATTDPHCGSIWRVVVAGPDSSHFFKRGCYVRHISGDTFELVHKHNGMIDGSKVRTQSLMLADIAYVRAS